VYSFQEITQYLF